MQTNNQQRHGLEKEHLGGTQGGPLTRLPDHTDPPPTSLPPDPIPTKARAAGTTCCPWRGQRSNADLPAVGGTRRLDGVTAGDLSHRSSTRKRNEKLRGVHLPLLVFSKGVFAFRKRVRNFDPRGLRGTINGFGGAGSRVPGERRARCIVGTTRRMPNSASLSRLGDGQLRVTRSEEKATHGQPQSAQDAAAGTSE